MTQQAYYSGSDYGGYQYVTLEDIIDNFMATYVGDEKILGRTRKSDINFHAHRALQELNYDTFKSRKSQEIEVCPNLKMPLPHDYVNYVKITRVDSNGVEHVLYPNRKTSNPFAIEQVDTNCEDCGDTSESYQFSGDDLKSQVESCEGETTCSFSTANLDETSHASATNVKSYVDEALDNHTMSTADAKTYWKKWTGAVDSYCLCLQNSGSTTNCGTQTLAPWKNFLPTLLEDLNYHLDKFAGWTNISGNATVININIATNGLWPSVTTSSSTSTSSSNAWDNWTSGPNSTEPSEEKWKDHYGQRYGLDPQHANSNGTFYMDELRGIIHFSSNLSGETIILKYISDGLGTDEEMIVPKLAEEAMYKWIAHGCLSAKANIPEYLVARFKKEKYAETRKAKIRLSNIKIEEITQVFRGKAKHIKH